VHDNVDGRLLARFQESCRRQEEARQLLPQRWLEDGRPAAQELNEIFVDVLARFRDRLQREREELRTRAAASGDERD